MLSLLRVGMATSLFFLITYVICVVGYLILPEWLMIPHNSLELFLPGFKLLTFGSFVLGAIEAYVFGWYVGALFGALYNRTAPNVGARSLTLKYMPGANSPRMSLAVLDVSVWH